MFDVKQYGANNKWDELSYINTPKFYNTSTITITVQLLSVYNISCPICGTFRTATMTTRNYHWFLMMTSFKTSTTDATINSARDSAFYSKRSVLISTTATCSKVSIMTFTTIPPVFRIWTTCQFSRSRWYDPTHLQVYQLRTHWREREKEREREGERELWTVSCELFVLYYCNCRYVNYTNPSMPSYYVAGCLWGLHLPKSE